MIMFGIIASHVCYLVLVWKEREASIDASMCLFPQCHGDANTDGFYASEANIKQSA
jgi:hypothetical protein